jgi:hypothetical protein
MRAEALGPLEGISLPLLQHHVHGGGSSEIRVEGGDGPTQRILRLEIAGNRGIHLDPGEPDDG